MSMPWNVSGAMQERTKFVVEAADPEANMTELCRQYGIARETGYKWLRRYEGHGPAGLAEGSHVAKHRPHAMPEAIREAIVALRRSKPSWGAEGADFRARLRFALPCGLPPDGGTGLRSARP